MRTTTPTRTISERSEVPVRSAAMRLLLTGLAGAVLTIGSPAIWAQTPSTLSIPQVVPSHKVSSHHKGTPAHTAVAAPAPDPAPAPPAPEPPKWPLNDPPAPPTVRWDSAGLHVDASNSSLRQILDDVASTTGAKVEGLGPDERVFGDYGPGPARDVISQILHGSSYNVLMLGDQGQGTPREIILSERTKGGAQQPGQNVNRPGAQDDDTDQPEPEEPNRQPMVPPVNQQPMNQPNGPMTPQQRMLEMQRQQMQMQQNPNQPIQPLPAPQQQPQ